MCYIMKCEWLKNESNYFVTCKYFRLILQPLQTVTNVVKSLSFSISGKLRCGVGGNFKPLRKI